MNGEAEWLEELWGTWGTNLALARKVRGYATQAAFARAVGCTQQQLSKWEAGDGGPSDRHKVAIGAVLGVDPRHLFPLGTPPPRVEAEATT